MRFLIFLLLFQLGHCASPIRFLSLQAEIPPEMKDEIYYLVVSLFVVFIILSTLLTGAFLVLTLILWNNFKTMKFYWFLTQLTFCVFLLSTLNLIINVPATLFSFITVEFIQTELYTSFSYIIDFLHYSILFSNLVIAIQRFFVFFFRHLTYRVFDSTVVYAWLGTVWFVSGVIILIMASNGCKFIYYSYPTNRPSNFVLHCSTLDSIVDKPTPRAIQLLELIVQMGIPIFIFILYVALIIKIFSMQKSGLSRNENRILIQAFLIFLLFQSSSILFLLAQHLVFHVKFAFVIKRAIHTMEIFAGAVTPCFFFFTSREIRKIMTTKVATVSSQGTSNVVPRKPTLVEVSP